MPVEVIFAVEEDAEGGYTAQALGYPVFTQADSLPELREQVRDAVCAHFEDADRPSVVRLT